MLSLSNHQRSFQPLLNIIRNLSSKIAENKLIFSNHTFPSFERLFQLNARYLKRRIVVVTFNKDETALRSRGGGGLPRGDVELQPSHPETDEERLVHRDVHVTHSCTSYTELGRSETLRQNGPSKATSTLFNRKWAWASVHLDAAERPPLWSKNPDLANTVNPLHYPAVACQCTLLHNVAK